ncbi:MAG TPA: ATP-dependent DNA ligase [Bryobacteraceae bacterium]|nr:ATP-dependent DNA ligase [Bryobacteraceae bacterium]
MLLATVVETSGRVSETSKRLEKIELLASLLRRLDPEEVEIVVDFLSGTTRQGRIGIGWAGLREAAAPPAETAVLEIHEVDRALDEFAKVRGAGSDKRKREILHRLLARATEREQQFLNGLLVGELRQGALEGIMLEAIAKASGVAVVAIRRAAMMAGEQAAVARAALESGAAGLDRFDVRLFRPVQPMLAQTAEDVAGALGDLGEAALEFKFDGARVQVHRSGEQVVVYSRSLNDVTAAVPEIVEAARSLPASDFILDGEVLSLTPEGRPQPFQTTMRRFGRRLDVERMRAELPLTPVWFDLLYLDGTPVLDEPQERRFAQLSELSPPAALVPHLRTADPERAAEFLRESLERGHEGIMAKAVDAGYAAGARGRNWQKVKVARSLDLVILAAEWGHGRRRGKLSNLHLGARDTVKGGFAMLGKTFKGLTDEMLAWQTEKLLKLEIVRDEYTVYVEPKLVVEIAFNEIQVSPRYPSGLALRFARVKRYRPDKSAADCDTFETVQKLAGMIA